MDDSKTIVLGELPMPKESVPKAMHNAIKFLGCHLGIKGEHTILTCPEGILEVDLGDPSDGTATIIIKCPAT